LTLQQARNAPRYEARAPRSPKQRCTIAAAQSKAAIPSALPTGPAPGSPESLNLAADALQIRLLTLEL